MIAILDYGAVRVFRVVLMTCMIQRIRAQIVMPILDDIEVAIVESKKRMSIKNLNISLSRNETLQINNS